MDYITLLEQSLLESVDFMPGEEGVWTEDDGTTSPFIGFPESGVVRKVIKCEDCKGTGKETWGCHDCNATGTKDGHTCPECHGKSKREYNCNMCFGRGEYNDTEYNFPSMNVSNGNVGIIVDILQPNATEIERQFIPHERLPDIMRRLIALKNRENNSEFEREESVTKDRRVDRSGDVPRITSGPTMHDLGVSGPQVDRYIDRLIDLVRWAQENNCGIYWA